MNERTPEQAWENAFQTHLRSARYWEAREHRPPVPEADLRRQFEAEGRRAWRVCEYARERLMREPDSSPPSEDLAALIARGVAQGLQDTAPIRHIHHHGPSLPPAPVSRLKHRPVDL